MLLKMLKILFLKEKGIKCFNVIRDTSNDVIKAVYKMGEKPPSIK